MFYEFPASMLNTGGLGKSMIFNILVYEISDYIIDKASFIN
jgi:hypothetical protein